MENIKELIECADCTYDMEENQIEFIYNEKPYCKNCVFANKDLHDKSIHSSRLLITNALWGLTIEEQKELEPILKKDFPEWDLYYNDLLYKKQEVTLKDEEGNIIKTISNIKLD